MFNRERLNLNLTQGPTVMTSFPDPNVLPEFTGDNGITYTWDATDGKWVVKGFSTEVDPRYVKKVGDEMTGSLGMKASDVVFQPIDDLANAGTDTAERWSSLVSKRVRDDSGTVLGGSNDFGIRVDLTEGRTGYNKFEFFANVDGSSVGSKFADFGGGNNPTFRFRRGNFQMEGNRIQKLGDAEIDTDAVPYGQVKEELADLRDSLIQDLSFGTWRYNSQSVLPPTGRFFARNDAGANSGISPESVTSLTFHEDDLNGFKGGWDRVEVGELFTLNSANGLQVKYKINSAPTVSGPSNENRTVEVAYVSKLGAFNFVDTIDWTFILTEFKDIEVDALDDTYLRIDCDNSPLVTSQGLEIKTDSDAGGGFGEASLTLNGKRDNKNNSVASIKFKNWNYDDSDTVNGYITYRTVGTADGYFRFSKDVELHSRDLLKVSNLKLTNPGSIWSDTNERIKFKTATAGNNGDGIVEFTRPNTNARRGITIRGKDTSNADNDIFYTYTNSSGGDAINYLGKQAANSNNLATTKYVDNVPTGVLEGKLKNKGSLNDPTSGQFVPMYGASYNSGNVNTMNRIQLHSLDGYDFRTTGSAACPGTLTVMSRGDCYWHGIIEKKSVSGNTCTIYLIKLYAKSAAWDTTSDYYFHINGFKRDLS